MKHFSKKAFIIVLTIILSTSIIYAQEKDKDSENHIPINVSVFYPLSLNKTDDISTNFNLSWIYGSIGSVHGVELSGCVNRVKRDVWGFESAGLLNYVNGKVDGFQSAGLINYVGKNFKGFQTAGTVNYIGGNFKGIQVGGVLNYNAGSFKGMQIAGNVNLTRSNFQGVQITGTVNFIQGDLTGLQVSVLNIAGNVKGSQIGVVNICNSIQGFPIGLINYAREGKIHPIMWYSNIMQANLGVKFAVNDYFYSILSGGYNNQSKEIEESFALGYYIGVHYPINKDGYYILGLNLGKLYFDADLGYLSVDNDELFKLDDGNKNQNMLQARFIMGYELWPGLSLFAGIGESYSVDHDQTARDGETETLYTAGIQLY